LFSYATSGAPSWPSPTSTWSAAPPAVPDNAQGTSFFLIQKRTSDLFLRKLPAVRLCDPSIRPPAATGGMAKVKLSTADRLPVASFDFPGLALFPPFCPTCPGHTLLFRSSISLIILNGRFLC